ncbi:MAG TPA: head GIN domain-containing protein [Puia sp.]|nr:head GIN domain-containing protein [Puia sp.]
MQRISFILAACLILNSAMAQTVVHDANARSRTVGEFHAIHVSAGIHVYFTQGNERAVAVSAADPDVRDKIRTEVVDGVLKIYYDSDDWKFWKDNDRRRDAKAYVSNPKLDGIKAASGSNFEVDGMLKSGNLAMSLSSGAHFNGKVEVGELSVDGSSGAHGSISGTASSLKVETSSGSHVDAFDLQTDNCDARTSSGAHVDITVRKELSVSASSGGHVYYKGDGVIRNVNTSSGGGVSRK